jgi:protocatechuate 3,4-dioxygenase beta subunit
MTKHASAFTIAVPLLTRRKITSGLLATLGGVFAFRSLAACAGGGEIDDEADDGEGSSSGAASSSSSSSSSTGGTTTGAAGAWATGGTQSMTAKATYSNPFATPATSCVLLTAATEGPCTEAADQDREDISEGYTGLPMRLAFRVVDTACNPIAGAKVKVWHTQLNGSYSGNTPNPQMCVKDSADYAKHYFRGVQTTDDDGVVYFDSCFPGWYRGRTPHIHYTVTIDGKSFTSQVVFDQTLVQEIFSTHAEYETFGQPDTTNTTDNVVGNNALSTYILSTERQSDGAMLAWKQLVVFIT